MGDRLQDMVGLRGLYPIYDILGIDTVIIGLLIPKGGVFDDWIRILQLKCVKKVKLHFSFLEV